MAAARTAAEAAMPTEIGSPSTDTSAVPSSLSLASLRRRTEDGWRKLIRDTITECADEGRFSAELFIETTKRLNRPDNIAQLKVYIDIMLEEANELEVFVGSQDCRFHTFEDFDLNLVEAYTMKTFKFIVMWKLRD